jgi:hypothetical protein
MNEKIELQLQRLADGELDRRQLRLMLQQAQRQPELWQAMALAFIENQIIHQEIVGSPTVTQGSLRKSSDSSAWQSAEASRAAIVPAVGNSPSNPNTVSALAGSASLFDSQGGITRALQATAAVVEEGQPQVQPSPPHHTSRSTQPSWRWWSALAATWLLLPMAYWFGNNSPAIRSNSPTDGVTGIRTAPTAENLRIAQSEADGSTMLGGGSVNRADPGNPRLPDAKNNDGPLWSQRSPQPIPGSEIQTPRSGLSPGQRSLTDLPSSAPFSLRLVNEQGNAIVEDPIPVYTTNTMEQFDANSASNTVPEDLQRDFNRLGYRVVVDVMYIRGQLEDGRELIVPLRKYYLTPIGQ